MHALRHCLVQESADQILQAHPELQPLWGVAVRAAYAVRLSSSCFAVLGTKEEFPGFSREQTYAWLLGAPRVLTAALGSFRREWPLLQQQLAGVGGSLFTARQLELVLQQVLAVVHTWAATPGGPYRGGPVDAQHVAAGRAAFSAALQLAEGEASTSDVWSGLANLLRRTGARRDADQALRRSWVAAQAAGDPMRQLMAGGALASTLAGEDGWRYDEVASILKAVRACLKDCKPWLPRPLWSESKQVHLCLLSASMPCPGPPCSGPAYHLRVWKAALSRDGAMCGATHVLPGFIRLQRVRFMAGILADVRRRFPANYASRPLPCCTSDPQPNTCAPEKVQNQASGQAQFTAELWGRDVSCCSWSISRKLSPLQDSPSGSSSSGSSPRTASWLRHGLGTLCLLQHAAAVEHATRAGIIRPA